MTNGDPVEGKRIKIINGFSASEAICNTTTVVNQIGIVLRYNSGDSGDLLVELVSGVRKRISFPSSSFTSEAIWVEESNITDPLSNNLTSNVGKKVVIRNYINYPQYEGKIGTILQDEESCDYFEVRMDEDSYPVSPYKPTYHPPQCEFFIPSMPIIPQVLPMREYIGRKAKVLPNARGDADRHHGEIVTIIRMQAPPGRDGVLIAQSSNGNEFNLISPRRGENTEMELLAKDIQIELVITTIPTRDFEAGDKVVVLPTNTENTNCFYLEKIYTILKNDHTSISYQLAGVFTGDAVHNSYTWANKVRFATPEEILANIATINIVKGEKTKFIPVSFLLPEVIDTTTIKGRILDCIINTPHQLGVLKNSIEDRKYYDKIINSILPYKVGIEIECIKSLSKALYPTLNSFFDRQDSIKNKYHISDFSDDGESDNTSMCENRMCFKGHKEVAGLANILALMSQHCILDTKGGIHYHIDCPEMKLNSTCTEAAKKFLHKRLDQFNDICHYTGSFNRKDVGIGIKGTWINIRRSLGTIEVRIAAPSFDYQHIIREIIAISKIITEMRNELKLNKYKL